MTKAREIAELGQKLTVDASGNLDIAGTIEADGLTSSAAITIDGASAATFVLNEGDTTDKNHRIRQNGGNFSIQKVSDDGATVTNNFLLSHSGDISFYDDSGNQKFYWDASAESLKLGHATTTFGDNELDLVGDGNGVRSGMVWMRSGVGDSVHQINVNGSTLEFGSGGALDTTPSISIKSTGNVGIGSTNPTYKLVVSDGGAAGIEFGPEYAGDTNLVQHYDRTANQYMDVNNIAQNHRFGRGASEWMRITNTGKVGIGTSTPQNVLSINSGDNREMQFLEVSDVMQMRATSDSGSYTLRQMGLEGSEIFLKTQTTSNTSGLTRMYVASDGDVGIGTTSPATKLDVAGTTTTDGLTLDAISETISDTAVDIFVYDTSKDSDGGAWRKRTQHTSWYNETLNTSTRGSRKEFPAVAVIVVTDNTLTIYDGDDPSLPMWMKPASGSADDTSWLWAMSGSTDITSVQMLNGTLVFGRTGQYNGLTVVDLIRDEAFWTWQEISSDVAAYYFWGTASTGNRRVNVNGAETWLMKNGIINPGVNDVAMTVLPNAPIDAATGLPVPTIAVATDGGVSVIKDDGTVVDITGTNWGSASKKVSIDNKGVLYFTQNAYYWMSVDLEGLTDDIALTDGRGSYSIQRDAYPFKQITCNDYAQYGAYEDAPAWFDGSYNMATLVGSGSDDYRPNKLGRYNYFSRSHNDYLGDSHMLYNYTTSSYNTGWMNGDIKLATLSDTDDTNVTGSELVTNGTFDTNTSGWTAGNSTISVVSGKLRISITTSGLGYAYQTITTVVGKKYTATVQGSNFGSIVNWGIRVGTSAGSDNVDAAWVTSSDTTATVTFTATSTTTYINLGVSYTAGVATDFDNISVRLAEEDRSVNGNGLQVFGTVTKSAVATGADLVGYSFGSGQYLRARGTTIPTGDACYMWWSKDIDGDRSQFYVGDLSASVPTYGINVWSYNGMKYRYAGAQFDGNSSHGIVAGWNHHCLISRNSKMEVWVNGKKVAQASGTHNSITETDLYVGKGYYNSSHSTGMALFRISATAPSPEQIKKIYEDEKVLFQEGAQATLYGSSDAVTALAYDDSTNLLHVGTSAGRSVFQGLRRVDNTTTAVGAAISASNGLVADE